MLGVFPINPRSGKFKYFLPFLEFVVQAVGCEGLVGVDPCEFLFFLGIVVKLCTFFILFGFIILGFVASFKLF